jgi:hypothetical protein
MRKKGIRDKDKNMIASKAKLVTRVRYVLGRDL